jgi:hypothetical protein
LASRIIAEICQVVRHSSGFYFFLVVEHKIKIGVSGSGLAKAKKKRGKQRKAAHSEFCRPILRSRSGNLCVGCHGLLRSMIGQYQWSLEGIWCFPTPPPRSPSAIAFHESSKMLAKTSEKPSADFLQRLCLHFPFSLCASEGS